MPIRKKGDVEIQASASGTKVRQTGYTFYSYDKNSAALYFQFREQDGQPTDLSKATVHLVMILNDDGGKEFIPKSDEIEVLSAIRGTAKYVLPDNLLGYEGKVTSYVYLDFSDGSHTDEGHFAFEIKRSLITDVIPEAGDKYVKDFEDIKAEVQEAADGAKETISQKVTEVSDTSDSAISKVNQVADGATESITTAADSIDKAKSNAEATISEYVSSVGSAKEAAEKRINDASGEVETAKVEAIKNMSELDISDKNYLLESKKKVLESRTSGNPEDNSNYATYFLSEPIQAGVEFTVSGQLEITDGDFDTISIKFRDENGENIGGGSFYVEHSGNEFSETFTLSKTLYKIYIYAGKTGETRGNGVIYENVKLQPGSIATAWTPNPSEIMTQKQYDKIAKAITSLGGSI
ncbi:BppU family phage baseplate upper protein [Tetragenococcus koreensis]|uniref:BppU family phage baseplate upper protein n=1 Tax=Tetragenococcus koreensis TaxID=290335 RepID=UPI001F317D7D|nr:BppU family phage baseplate upper protein [Tetragenococcus koreensis]MCF1585243.1 BppU family phage baseplate upper protein [Tetragenococcus koreensis]MCF1628780.1 BppU family phage baseplate upper protein [Tetragenococcus koreensis]